MCEFHSTAWRLLGNTVECCHDPDTNSHTTAIYKAGWRENLPFFANHVFEAEWDGQGELPPDKYLIRNHFECPERLVNAIQNHYRSVAAAITSGKGLDTIFATEKWSDVWNKAIKNEVSVPMPRIFFGNLEVLNQQDWSGLIEVRGSLAVLGGLIAINLCSISEDLVVEGPTKLDSLTSVGRDVDIHYPVTLSRLKAIYGNLVINRARRVELPLLTNVYGTLNISNDGVVEIPLLKKKPNNYEHTSKL